MIELLFLPVITVLLFLIAVTLLLGPRVTLALGLLLGAIRAGLLHVCGGLRIQPANIALIAPRSSYGAARCLSLYAIISARLMR